MTSDAEQEAADEAVRRLAASERRFRALVTASADAALLMRADGTVEYLSPQVSRALGPEGAATRDGEFVRAIHRDDRHEVIEVFRAAFAGGPGDHFTVTHRM